MTTPSRGIDVAVMRGGTSRGPVLDLGEAPEPGEARDELALRLVGGQRRSVEGLGGGSSTTNKVVLVGAAGTGHAADLDYVVGNVSPCGTEVDWSGTCGNMTAAVVPYGLERGLIAHRHGPWTLRNLATGGDVEVDLESASRPGEGDEYRMRTTYLDPGGAVLGQMLPTGRTQDDVSIGWRSVACSLVDVAHPYLFVRATDLGVPAQGEIDVNALRLVEELRGTVCVGLGLVENFAAAAVDSPAVPRVVLIHDDPSDALRITAVSMGQAIGSVPVTAALAAAAASQIGGTIVADAVGPVTGRLVVAGPDNELEAWAATCDGVVVSAGVERTARCLMRGRAWL